MNRNFFRIIAVGCLSMIGEAHANPQLSKPVQFYAGLSGGIQHMSGKRNESVFNAPNSTITFADGISSSSLSSNNGHYSLFGGFSMTIPNVPIFIGPEISIGRGNTQNEHAESVIDEATGLRRAMQTQIRQLNFLGGSLQVGTQLPWQSRGFVLLGIDLSQYRYSTLYVPRSANAINPAVDDFPPASFASTKWLRGFMWGIGLEKEYKCFRVGGDIRVVTHKMFRKSFDAPSGNAARPIDAINSFFKPKVMRFSLRFSYLF